MDKMAAIYEKEISFIAILSRLFVFMLQVFFNYIIPDHEPDVFNPPVNISQSLPDKIVSVFLSGFRRWDAVYFLHISEHGYTYENCLAFFPLFPLTTRFISSILYIFLQSILNYSNILLLSSFLLNQYLFIKTAVILYKLGIKVLNNETLAYWAAIMFCINPASIFMSAPYSEIIYAFVTFQGMLIGEEGNFFLSSLLISLGTFSRSNGIVVAGYIVFPKLIICLSTIVKSEESNYRRGLTFVQFVSQSILYLVIAAMPLLLFQYYAYLLYCTKSISLHVSESLSNYGRSRGYKIVGDPTSSWCNDTIAISYSYVQSSHWDVGFFKYYTWKQIPNFLLATPVTILSISAVVVFVQKNSFSMNFIQRCGKGMSKKCDEKECGFTVPAVFPYVMHLTFLTIFGWLFIHIQVLTRMLTSSCPPLYWFAAQILTSNDALGKAPSDTSRRHRSLQSTVRYLMDWQNFNYKAKLVLLYFISYMIIGTFTFSNFLPWT